VLWTRLPKCHSNRPSSCTAQLKKKCTLFYTVYTGIVELFKGNKNSCSEQTKRYSKVFHFTQTVRYKELIQNLYGVAHLTNLTDLHIQISRRLLDFICAALEAANLPARSIVLSEKTQQIAAELEAHSAGSSKVRYVAGYVVAKLKHKSIKANRSWQTTQTSLTPRQQHARVNVLQAVSGVDEAADTTY
jgi:hypothetical protein